jgi:hypothetical protein
MSWALAGNIKGPPGTVADAPVTSVFGRLGAIVADPADYSAYYAPLGAYESVLTFTRSLRRNVNTIDLVNDLADPTSGPDAGTARYYGLSPANVRGFYQLPAYTPTPPGGSDKQFQYNNNGAFAGQNALTMVGSQVQMRAGPQFAFSDNSDPTKLLTLSLANIPSGTSRALLIPNSTNPVAVGGVSASLGDFVTYIDNLGVQHFGSLPAPPTIPVSSVFGRTGAVVAQSGDYASFYEVPLTFAQSLSRTTNTVKLVGDVADPTSGPDAGTERYYGINASNTRGFYQFPAAAVTSVFGRTGAIAAAVGDYSAFYPQLSASYNNPSWITGLAWSKITGAPSFEPALGNPASNGMVLSSTTAGVRSWIAVGGAQTITLTGDVTGSGTTSINCQIAAGVITATEIAANAIGASEMNNTQDMGMQALQTIKLSTSATSDVQTCFGVYRNSTGTPLAGLGSRIELGAKSSTTNDRGQCLISSRWLDPTDATRSAYMELFCSQGDGLYGTSVLKLWPSKGVSINGAADPGAGYINTPSAGGYKINGVIANVPTGGTTGQYLKKNSSTNYDCSWDQHSYVQGTQVSVTAGTTSTAGVMAGLPGSITPSTTGRVMFIVSGYLTSSSAGAFACIVSMRYGTGSAPSHGAAATGTAIPNCPNAFGHSSSANFSVPFSLAVIITGLTVGTTYWLDVVYGSSAAGSTARLNTVSLCAIEF